MSSVVTEVSWLVGLFQELNNPLTMTILVFSNSNSVMQLASNLVFQERTKHIKIDCHFIRYKIKNGLIQPIYVHTHDQVVDLLNKGLIQAQYTHLLVKLSMLSIMHPTA